MARPTRRQQTPKSARIKDPTPVLRQTVKLVECDSGQIGWTVRSAAEARARAHAREHNLLRSPVVFGCDSCDAFHVDGVFR